MDKNIEKRLNALEILKDKLVHSYMWTTKNDGLEKYQLRIDFGYTHKEFDLTENEYNLLTEIFDD